MAIFISAVIAFVAGLAIALLVHLVRMKNIDAQKRVAEARLADAEVALTREREHLTNLQVAFKGVSSEVLKESREEFLRQAEPRIGEYVRTLHEALKRYDEKIQDIEGKREKAYGGIERLLGVLQEGQSALTHETGSLVAALKSPAARGRWGEVTLKRVVEVAGMSGYCDFEEQVTVDGDDGGRQRPDLVVRLPGGRNVVVDAKAPLDAYMGAVEAADDTSRTTGMAAHAQMIREHMRRLGQKAYWAQFDPAPDFVVLFLPGESFFSAALEQDRQLIEDGMKSRVILATPTTLIVLLRSIAMGWQQEHLAENSIRISEAGKELFERVTVFASHLDDVGRGLEKAIRSYNSAIGSWESRVIPGARRLKELGAAKDPGQDVTDIGPIETIPRQIAPPQE